MDEKFRAHLDPNFTLPAEEGIMSHRAVKLTNLTPELSGNYKCRVSGLLDEDFRQKNMIVFGKTDE